MLYIDQSHVRIISPVCLQTKTIGLLAKGEDFEMHRANLALIENLDKDEIDITYPRSEGTGSRLVCNFESNRIML